MFPMFIGKEDVTNQDMLHSRHSEGMPLEVEGLFSAQVLCEDFSVSALHHSSLLQEPF